MLSSSSAEQRPRVDVELPAGAPNRPAIGADVVLHLLQQRRPLRAPELGCSFAVRNGRSEHELHFAGITPPRLQERVVGRARGGVVRPGEDGATSGPTTGSSRSHSAGEGWSRKRWTSRPSPIAFEHVEIAGRQTRQPEQGQPGREVEHLGLFPQALAGVDQSLGRARLADPGPQQPPQLHLPGRFVRGRRPHRPPNAAAFRAGARRSGRRDRPRVGWSRTALNPAPSRICGCAVPAAPATARRSVARPPRAGATPPVGAAMGPRPGRCPRPRRGRR